MPDGAQVNAVYVPFEVASLTEGLSADFTLVLALVAEVDGVRVPVEAFL